MTLNSDLITKLPHGKDFLFVDSIEEVNETKILGTYTFPEKDFYVTSHFKDYPIVPGVLLTESAAQIGLGCMGIYLLQKNNEKATSFVLTSSHMDFLWPVFPGESIRVEASVVYFRFYKLKVNVQVFKENDLVAKGVLDGMVVRDVVK